MTEKIKDFQNNELLPKEKCEMIFEKFKERDDVALIFLKGGEKGGLNEEIKKEILLRLDSWFEVVEGEARQLPFDEISARWSSGYLNYPSLKTIQEKPEFTEEFLTRGKQSLLSKDQEGFENWFNEAKTLAGDDPGLLRLELLITYFKSGGENILLKMKSGVTRQRILADLDLNDKSALVKTVGEEKAEWNWWDSKNVSTQEFVKRIVVGDTTALKAVPGTLRSILAKKIKDKEFFACLDLWDAPDDEWALQNKLVDQKLVMSNLLNAIHSAGSDEELRIEFNLLTEKDLDKFYQALK